MAGYLTELDIANRAAQHCRRSRFTAFDNSNEVSREMAFSYDKLRQAELSDHLWSFATKRVVLRPVDTVTAVLEANAETLSGTTLPFDTTAGVLIGQLVQGTNIAAGSTVASLIADTSVTLSLAITGTVAMGAAITFGPLSFLYTPPAWLIGTTYAVGNIVTYGNDWWQSKVAANLANTPAQGAYWTHYTGVDYLQAWNTSVGYFPGELALASDGSVYMSLITSNTSHDPTTTTGFWLLVNGTASGLQILYPIGTGPRTDPNTNYVFRLPRGFLRRAPTMPKVVGNWLGAPQGITREDWVFEGDYIVSAWNQPILLRYVADWIDVPEMHPLFCEMLSARIAEEMAPRIANPDVLQVVLATTERHYAREKRQAERSNAIEIGSADPPIDSYISVRW
jgi:hypothetical protein